MQVQCISSFSVSSRSLVTRNNLQTISQPDWKPLGVSHFAQTNYHSGLGKKKNSLSMTSPSVVATVSEITSMFTKSSSNSLHLVQDLALSTPPITYFLALTSAGIGIPVSEDAICIVAGTILTKCDKILRWKLIWCLYFGVVISDALTFWLGRALRVGVLDPVRKFMKIAKPEANSENVPTTELSSKATRKRKRDRMKAKIEKSGDYIGFVVRLSVGMRGPMMLLTGFTNTVPFVKYLGGTLLGAAVSLSLQLAVGLWMSGNLVASKSNLLRPEVLIGSTIGVLLMSILIRNIFFIVEDEQGEEVEL